MKLRPSNVETHGIKDRPTSERPPKPLSQYVKEEVNFEDEVYQLVQQFIKNDNKAIEYYEKNLIGYENMLKMKRDNTDNIISVLMELK